MDVLIWVLLAPFIAALFVVCLLTVFVFVVSAFGMLWDLFLKAIHAVGPDYESPLTRLANYFH